MFKRHLKDRLWGSHFSSIEWLLFLCMYGVHGCIIPRHDSFAWPSMLSVVSRGWATARSSRTRKWHDSSSCRTLSTNRSDSRFAWLLLSFITAYLKPYQFALTTFLSLFGSLLNHTFILVVKKTNCISETFRTNSSVNRIDLAWVGFLNATLSQLALSCPIISWLTIALAKMFHSITFFPITLDQQVFIVLDLVNISISSFLIWRQ